ncbi:MAG: hypothetical protein ACE5DO_06225, partial [Desulfobacterales bacterium]
HSRLVVENTAFAILPAVLWTNAITLVLISLAAVVIILLISHKIAGPMFRFEKDLLEIGEGNLVKRVSLRKKDQFTDLSDSLNRMTESLQRKVAAVGDEVALLIKSAKKQQAPQQLTADLEHLKKLIDRHFIV